MVILREILDSVHSLVSDSKILCEIVSGSRVKERVIPINTNFVYPIYTGDLGFFDEMSTRFQTRDELFNGIGTEHKK